MLALYKCKEPHIYETSRTSCCFFATPGAAGISFHPYCFYIIGNCSISNYSSPTGVLTNRRLICRERVASRDLRTPIIGISTVHWLQTPFNKVLLLVATQPETPELQKAPFTLPPFIVGTGFCAWTNIGCYRNEHIGIIGLGCSCCVDWTWTYQSAFVKPECFNQ